MSKIVEELIRSAIYSNSMSIEAIYYAIVGIYRTSYDQHVKVPEFDAFVESYLIKLNEIIQSCDESEKAYYELIQFNINEAKLNKVFIHLEHDKRSIANTFISEKRSILNCFIRVGLYMW